MNPDPSPEAMALIAVWPSNDWITEAALVQALSEAGLPVHPTHPGGPRFQGRNLRALLGEARRRSWLLRDQKVHPPVYKRPVPGFRGA